MSRSASAIDAERAAIVAEARSWLGTPFHHAARIKGVGVDCAQLLAAVYETAGLIPPVAFDRYPPQWMLHRSDERLLDVIARHARNVIGSTGPGDLVLFRHGRAFSHGAIILDWPVTIHASPRAGVILDEATGAGLGGREKRFFSVF